MAVGMDKALPQFGKAVLTPPPQGPMQPPSIPGYSRRPPAISDSAVQGAVNNQLAAGYGAREMTLADSNRSGVSRGKGQQYAARMAQEAADAKAAAGAVQTEMGAAASNAAARQAYDMTMQGERAANANLLEGLRNTQAMERAARSGWQQDLYEAIRRGQFGLDQQQLDYTPLLRGLFE
jgi:hypothetical protein